MGNDGGSIPKRRELVKEAAKDLTTTQVKEAQKEQQEHGWVTCALSHQTLSPPIVSDWSGKLFNKDAVLESLIAGNGEKLEDSTSKDRQVEDVRVGSLRDVIEVKFQLEGTSDQNEDRGNSTRWVCPITNKALGPGTKAVYLVPCGHAFSENALKELAGNSCLQCDEPFTPDNVVQILPVLPEDRLRLKERALRLRDEGLTHSLKKAPGASKKKRKIHSSEKADATVNGQDGVKTEVPQLVERKALPTPIGINNVGTASLTAKVLAEEQDRQKRRKLGNNENVNSLFSSSTDNQKKQPDFVSRGYSIPAGAR